MKILRITINSIIMGIALSPLLVPNAYGQSWLQFAHPSNPHNPLLIIPELLQGSGDVTISRPVLVVLMDYSDTTHRAEHNTPFWRDLVFSDPRAGIRPSIAQIYRENSNGRLLLVPALSGDVHDGNQDGVVGWVRTRHRFADALSPEHKRAEGIEIADPNFDYHVYDRNNDGLITSDELIILVVIGDQTAAGFCDEHIGHSSLPGCVRPPGGNTRATDPPQVPVDQDTQSPVRVYQEIAGVGEMAHEGVVAHEIAHSGFGHGDLYPRDPTSCTTCPYQQTTTGYLCDCIWHPPSPENYSIMDSYWVDYVPHMDPWAKIHLGFVEPLVVTHDGAFALFDAETERSFSTQATQPEAIIIYDPLRADPYEEYFVVENRNNPQLPDQGLTVWLINEDGMPNVDLRKVVRLIRRGRPGDDHWAPMTDALWDGVDDTHGYDFTATSTPRNTDWTDGTMSYIEVYDISQAGQAMTFKVRMPPIFVDWNNWFIENGTQEYPFDQVAEAIAAIPEAPRTIRIAGGLYPENLVINTPCTLKGWRNGNAIIGQ